MMRVPAEIMAGFYQSNSTNSNLPLAGIIDNCKSAKSQIKIKELRSIHPNVVVYSNSPSPGFHLRRNSDLNSRPCVIDPRGYVVNITSRNLNELLHTCTIASGLITDVCVWIRHGGISSLELVPVNSPRYQKALANTRALSTRVSADQVQIGDRVTTEYGVTATYMGKMCLYGAMAPKGNSRTVYAAQKYLNKHVFMLNDTQFFYKSGPKFISVVEAAATPMTQAQAVDKINGLIQAASTFFTSRPHFNTGYFSYYGKVKMVSEKRVTPIKITACEATREQAEALLPDCEAGTLLLIDSHGNKYSTRPHYVYFTLPGTKPTPGVDRVITLDSTELTFSSATACMPVTDLSKFDKYFIIKKRVGNEFYI